MGMTHELAAALNDLVEEEQPLGIDRANYVAAVRIMDRYADEYGEIPPVSDPDPEMEAKLVKYEGALRLMRSAVTNGERDVAECQAAADRLAEIDKAGKSAPVVDTGKLREHIEQLQGQLKTAQQDAAEFAKLADQVEKHKTVEKQAREYHVDVVAWLAIADELAPEGIPSRLLAEALGPVNDRLKASAKASEWPLVKIGANMDVTAGGRAYSLLSESEQWRTDAVIAEAIAHMSGVRLLVLDRFDVLDLPGRSDLICWVDALAQSGEIDSALIFGTLKSCPSGLPATIRAIWLENGVVPAVREAA